MASPLLQLLKERNPALLLTGQTISGFGDGVANVALTLLVLDTTHSVSKLAWFGAARMIPLVAFLLVGGAIVDRFSRRMLLLISDVARLLLTALIVLLLLLHHCTFPVLVGLALCFGAFDAVFMPAFTALVPEITPESLLPAMNGVRPITSNLIGQTLGPAAGGLLAAWSTSWAIGIDSATFACSAATLLAMRMPAWEPRATATSMLHDIREGLSYVRSTPWIWATLGAVTLLNALLFSPISVLVPFYIRHNLHLSASFVGYSFALFGAAGALGGLIASNRPTPRRRVRVMWSYWTMGGLSALVLLSARAFWPIAVFIVVAAIAMILGNVIWESMMQSEVPRELLGRVSSVDWFVSLGLSPVGIIVAGVVSGAIGIVPYFVVMAIVTTIPGVLVLLSTRTNAVDAGR